MFSSRARFFCLPLELRLKVYHYLYGTGATYAAVPLSRRTGPNRSWRRNKSRKHDSRLPSGLLLACCATFAEAAPIFYSQNTFRLAYDAKSNLPHVVALGHLALIKNIVLDLHFNRTGKAYQQLLDDLNKKYLPAMSRLEFVKVKPGGKDLESKVSGFVRTLCSLLKGQLKPLKKVILVCEGSEEQQRIARGILSYPRKQGENVVPGSGMEWWKMNFELQTSEESMIVSR